MFARFSIARLMLVVAIVALDVAIGRAVFAYKPDLLLATAPMALTLQFGTWSFVTSARPGRAF